MKVQHNIARLDYLLALFQMSVNELLQRITAAEKISVSKEDIWASDIKLSLLKRIDKIFNKGIQFYLDPTAPARTEDASIFFRKTDLAAVLNIGAKQQVNHFEEESLSLSALAKLSDVTFRRLLPQYTLQDDPKAAGRSVRQQLNPSFKKHPKDFLVELIRVLAAVDVMVYEFVETWNKTYKANIDGFFLQPNVIVLKRQRYFRREIFTLVHELAHYLLGQEVAEEVDYVQTKLQDQASKVEKWCNDFAWYFLSGTYDDAIQSLDFASGENDYHHPLVQNVSDNTHLSRTAIFTKLLFAKKISPGFYKTIRQGFEEDLSRKLAEEKKQRELDQLMGKPQKATAAVPIKSPLLVSTYQKAYFEGALNEYEFCKRLNIPSEKFDKFIYEGNF